MRELTDSETALVRIYERRADAYKLAETQRLEELKIVNESIASILNPSNASAGGNDVGEKLAEDPPGEEKVDDATRAAVPTEGDGEGKGEDVAGAPIDDPEKYKHLSKIAASASSRMQDKLEAKRMGKRKYDISAAPEEALTTQNSDGNKRTLKKMRKKEAIDEEDNIVDTEKVSSMLDRNGYISTEVWDPHEATSNLTFSLGRFGVNDED